MQLNERVKIGTIVTKNRIAVPPMVCFHWSDDNGYVTERTIEHYHDMAAGGAGFIIGEATAVLKRGRLHNTELGLWEDKQIEGWKRLADEVHQFDVPFVVQLLHAGVAGIDPDADCPSDYIPEFQKAQVVGHEMSKDRIHEVIDAYVQAARRAQKAGLDGIELHGCHSYLICQFFNKNVNKRNDEYGLHRERFAIEILDGIRQTCGDAFVAGIRLGAFEPSLEDAIENALSIKDKVDFIDVAYGFNGESNPTTPEGFPYSPAIYGAQEIKKRIPDKPVFGVDGIKDGKMALHALNLTGMDMVDVGRGFLVNPDFGNAVIEGKDCGRCLDCKPACHWSPFLNDGTVNCAGRTLFIKNNK